MHGSGSTAADQEAFTGMDATADSDGFIVAYPQGLIPEGSGFDWNVPGEPLVGGGTVPAGSADDVTFLTTLVHILEQRYCIDSGRVYATGFSGGSRIASQLACDASGTFAAIAPVSGLRRPTPCPTTAAGARSSPSTAPPTPSTPTAATVRPTGRTRFPRRPRTGRPRTAAPRRRTTSRARPGPSPSPSYTGCAEGATVELYTITGEGHEWPGGPHLPKSLTTALGPQSDAVECQRRHVGLLRRPSDVLNPPPARPGRPELYLD